MVREASADGPSHILAALTWTMADHIGSHTERSAEAFALNNTALEVARAANDDGYVAAALVQRGVFSLWQGDLVASSEALHAALGEIDARNLERERPGCLGWLRMVASQRGDFSEAARHHAAALRSLEGRRSQVARFNAALWDGDFAAKLGDYGAGIRILRDARAMSRELKDLLRGMVAWHLGGAILASGDHAGAIEPLTDAVQEFERHRQFAYLSMAQAQAAVARARSGDVHRARELVQAARRNALRWDFAALAWNEWSDAEVCEAEGHPEGSPVLFDRAVALVPAAFEYDTTVQRLALATFFVRQRRPADARPILEAAREFFHDPAAFRRRAEVETLLRQCDEVVAS
jgi:tetratricopeptide (TPR) repeat protein